MTENKTPDTQKNKGQTDIRTKLFELEREFLELRMSRSAGQVKDASRFKKLKAEISRLRLKESGG